MQALDWLRQHRNQAIRSVQPLPGLTACSRLVELESGEHYVLRTQTAKADNYGIDYRQEAVLLRYLAPLGFVPTVIYADADSALLNWIEGDTPDIFTDTLLKALAERLVQLHSVPLQAVGFGQHFATLDLAERCLSLWNNLPQTKRQQLDFSPPFKRIAPFRQAICHHDIHLANLVEQDGRLFLIDWEYAAVSDPALELGLFLHANSLSAMQQAVFFDHYFAKSGINRTACLRKMAEYQPEIEKLNALWFAL
ncbi:phosphotransferase [Glaesserella sp.]|uniref:phosphotransferase n=1 Tax=Glaesserella sp. TaxID=2094731 RepID=UPI00359F35CE